MDCLPHHIHYLVHNPVIFNHATPEINFKQTHISYVILTGMRAYKFKKPVNLDFLDFSTLQKRRIFCCREVILNQKAAPGLYLGVVCLRRVGGGDEFKLSDVLDPEALMKDESIAEDPAVVDFAVVMNEFDQEYLLDNRVAAGECTESDVAKLGQVLARYHATCPSSDLCKVYGQPLEIRRAFDQNYEQTSEFVGSLQTEPQLKETRQFTDSFFKEKSLLLTQRLHDNRIRECHGDLHLNNIVLLPTGEFLFFDCIEFSDAFRCVDTIYDLAFVVGQHRLCTALINSYLAWSSDIEGLRVLPLYLSRQAYVKAKVRSFLSVDPHADQAVRLTSRAEASAFYKLAWQCCQKSEGRLVVMAGVSGTGKTYWSRMLANWLGGRQTNLWPVIVLRSDVIRKSLYGIPIDSTAPQEAYSESWNRKTYGTMQSESISLASDGWTIIVDAKYDKVDRRNAIKKAANDAGVRIDFVHLRAPLDLISSRITQRASQTQKDVSDATFALVAEQLKHFEEFAVKEDVVEVDTSAEEEEILKRICYHLSSDRK